MSGCGRSCMRTASIGLVLPAADRPVGAQYILVRQCPPALAFDEHSRTLEDRLAPYDGQNPTPCKAVVSR